MSQRTFKKYFNAFLIFALLWLFGRFALPLAVPFLLGTGLALAAEPGVQLLSGRLGLPRGAAAGVSVTVTLVLLLGLLVLLASLLVRQLSLLAAIAPDLGSAASQGLLRLQDWLLSLAARTPEGIHNLLTRMVLGLSDSGSQLLLQLPRMAASLLGHIPDSFLGVGTGLLSAFLISARLPRLRSWLTARLPEGWHSRILPALQRMKGALFGWLRAQAKLAGLTFAIVTAGLLLLRIPHAPVWGVLIALVDAVPLLGTGILLVPWSIVSFLSGRLLEGVGLLGLFAATALTRSALEPRLVGRQLGLDPLVTLAALYLGYQLWGFGGLLAAPLAAVTVKEALTDPTQ